MPTWKESPGKTLLVFYYYLKSLLEFKEIIAVYYLIVWEKRCWCMMFDRSERIDVNGMLGFII